MGKVMATTSVSGTPEGCQTLNYGRAAALGHGGGGAGVFFRPLLGWTTFDYL